MGATQEKIEALAAGAKVTRLAAERPADSSLPRHLADDALRRRLLALADAVAVLLASLVVVLGQASVADTLWMASLLPLWLLMAKLHGLYDRDHRSLRHLTADELGPIIAWGAVSTAVSAPFLALTPAGAPGAGGAVTLWAAVVVLAAALRGLARMAWRRMTPPADVLLLGSGALERATRRKLELFGDIHARVAGRLDEDQVTPGDAEGLDHRMRVACGGTMPDRVVVCSQDVDASILTDVLRACQRDRVKLSVVPPLRGMFGTAVRLTHVAELPFVEYHTWDLSASTLTLKRCLDVVVAGVGLIVTTPLMLLAAVAIRLESRGPVLYRQPRAGLEGRAFRMVKFRTMAADADARLTEVVPIDDLEEPMFKLRDDPRITRVGRFLRRWSLDELPQLVNVLRGEMSLVGPRPEQLAIVERYEPEHRFRLEAKPGMTGPMQVFGRGDLDFAERLAIEREYIENVSVGRDLHILLLTVPAVLSGRGAF